jgi:hypothetical protein
MKTKPKTRISADGCQLSWRTMTSIICKPIYFRENYDKKEYPNDIEQGIPHYDYNIV